MSSRQEHGKIRRMMCPPFDPRSARIRSPVSAPIYIYIYIPHPPPGNAILSVPSESVAEEGSTPRKTCTKKVHHVLRPPPTLAPLHLICPSPPLTMPCHAMPSSLCTDPRARAQGALLKGVQMLNERMISRWRAEGFLDFAAADPARPCVPGASLASGASGAARRRGHAVEILRNLLAVDGGTRPVEAERHGGLLEASGKEEERRSGNRQAEGSFEREEAYGGGDGGEGGDGDALVGADRGRRQGGGITVGIGGQVASRLRPDPLVV